MFYLILSGKFTFNKLSNKHMSILAIYKNRFVKVSIVLWIYITQVLRNIKGYKLNSNLTPHVLFSVKNLKVNPVIDGNLYYTIKKKSSGHGKW